MYRPHDPSEYAKAWRMLHVVLAVPVVVLVATAVLLLCSLWCFRAYTSLPLHMLHVC